VRGDRGYPVRLRFAERGRVRFVSHRDVARAFDRAFRIEALPLAFTQGFSPRPRVSFGLALSVGHESDAEYLDVELATPVDVESLPPRLSAALPEGIDVTGAVRLVERAPALQEVVTEVEYVVAPALGRAGGEPVPDDLLADAARGVVAATVLPVARTRKGHECVDDVRPAIRAIRSVASPHGPALAMALVTRPRGARPRDVLDALGGVAGVALFERRVLRTHQWIERAGARLEPLEADVFTHALVEARAS
jgi:radical SAM-linked protein